MAAYQVLPFEPGSAEWAAARDMVIGSSDASAVLECSPYGMTRRRLYRQKRGLEPGQYEHTGMLLGKDYEVRAREMWEAVAGIDYPPTFIQSLEQPWAVASMDGLNGSLGWENKCCEDGSSQHLTFLNGGVSNHDFAQMQHQIGWMGLECVWYTLYLWRHCPYCRAFPEDQRGCDGCENGRIWHHELLTRAITADAEFIDHLKAAEAAFFADLQAGREPPLTDKDDLETDEVAFLEAAELYRLHHANEAQAKSEKAYYGEILKVRAKHIHHRVRGGGVLVTPKGIYVEKLNGNDGTSGI